MSSRPDLSVIVVNWNSKALLRQCLQSIFAQTHRCSIEIVVIDNASFDGCGDMLAAHFPTVRFIQSEKNLGFGRANNAAVAHSRGDILLFLNPDTEVIGDALDLLVDAARTLPACGAVGGTLLNADRTVQTSALLAFPTVANQLLDSNFLRRLWPRSRLWGMAPLFSSSTTPTEVEAISGACLMIPRAVFEAIGGFSADYFMYSEDTDICYKAHLCGYKNYYVPGAQAVHYGDGSVRSAKSNFAVVMATESLWRFMAKHRGRAHALAYRCGVLCAALFRLSLLGAHRLLSSFRRSPQPRPNSLPKWNTILRWTLSLESWVLKY